VLQKKQHTQRHIDVMSPSKLRMAESSFSSVSPVKKQPNMFQQPKIKLENTNSLNRATEVSGAVTATTAAGVSSTQTNPLVLNKGPLSSPASQVEKPAPVASRTLQLPAPSKSEAQKQTSSASSAATTHVSSVSRSLSAPQVPGAKQSASVPTTVQNAPLISRSMSAIGGLGNEPSVNAPSYIPGSRTYHSAMMEKSSVGGSGFTNQPVSSEQGAHWQSIFTSQPSILSSGNLPRKEETSLRPGFTFGTVKPESLNQYQCREESSQQASSSSSSSNNDSAPAVSLNIGSEIEKLNLQGRSRSKQLSEISTRFTPYQPQGVVGDEFPHLDIINDLLDEEQSERRKALQHGFVRQYSMLNDASTPDCDMFGDPYLFDQSEQYFEEEPPRFYSPLGMARGLRDRSYSHFDLPSYSTSGQYEDMMMMGQWPYSRTGLSMPSFGSDSSAYSYQSQDYPNLSNGAGRYPSYRPANGY
jgi:hypothetical protein